MSDVQAKVAAHLDRIESTLHALLAAMDQERADLGTADHARAGELAHVAGKLDEIESFWICNGPEYVEQRVTLTPQPPLSGRKDSSVKNYRLKRFKMGVGWLVTQLKWAIEDGGLLEVLRRMRNSRSPTKRGRRY